MKNLLLDVSKEEINPINFDNNFKKKKVVDFVD